MWDPSDAQTIVFWKDLLGSRGIRGEQHPDPVPPQKGKIQIHVSRVEIQLVNRVINHGVSSKCLHLSGH